MRYRLHSLALLVSCLAGCATASTSPHTATANSVATASVHTGVDMAVLGLSCMLSSEEPSNECQQLAHRAGVSIAALTHGEPGAVELVTEEITRETRASGVNIRTREVLARWFDLAAGAMREALRAKEGSMCTNVEHCTLQNEGHPPLEALESAAHLDVAGVRSSESLDALFQSIPRAGALAADVEASALLILQHRMESALHARPEVRTDALEGLLNIAQQLPSSASTQQSTPADRTAHAPVVDPATVIRDARHNLTMRLESLAGRLSTPSMRRLADAALSELNAQSEAH